MIDSITGKIAGMNFRLTRLGTLAVATAFTIRAPSTGQLARRQAFSRCSRLWKSPNDVINLIIDDHAVLAQEPRWTHILSANLNNEIDASGWLPLPWDGTLDPLTGVTAAPGIAPGFVRLEWDASGNEGDDNVAIATRELKTAPDIFDATWFATIVTFQQRTSHAVNIYGLASGVLYQFSLTPYGSAPFSFARSVNVTSYPKP